MKLSSFKVTARRRPLRTTRADCLVDARADCATSLAWHADTQRLFWIDAPAAKLHAVSLRSGVVRSWPLPCAASAMMLCGDGRVMVALVDGVYLFDPATYDLDFVAALATEPVAIAPEAADAEGGRWVCDGAGGSITRAARDGEADLRIKLPVPAPTTCCFGGADMRLLFVGSRRTGLSPQQLLRWPASGGIFMLRVDVAGVPARRYHANGHGP